MRFITTVKVENRLLDLLPAYRYREAITRPFNPAELYPVEGFTTAALAIRVFVDVQAQVESGETQFMKVNFNVYAMPNQYTAAKERRLIGCFLLDLMLADDRQAIKTAIEVTVAKYINQHTNH